MTRGRPLLTAAIGCLSVVSAPVPTASVTPLCRDVAAALPCPARVRGGGRRRSPESVKHAPSVDPDTVGRPRFNLTATPRGRPASGWVELSPAASPFGIAVSREGRIIYDLWVVAAGLPDPSTLGNYTIYEAWLTTPRLEPVTDLGRVHPGEPLHARADWNKFTIVVSAEQAAPVNQKRWAGPVVLIGRSPSSLMQSFVTHPLYNIPEPD